MSWTAIVGETAATYTLAQADVGHRVRVVVGFTDGQGTAEALTSAASGPVTNVNEAPTGAVVIRHGRHGGAGRRTSWRGGNRHGLTTVSWTGRRPAALCLPTGRARRRRERRVG